MTETKQEIEVVVVGAEDCHFCHAADEVLQRLGERYPLAVRHLDMTSPEGEEWMRRTRAPFPPVLVVGGQVFGYGRISARKLERHLAKMMG